MANDLHDPQEEKLVGLLASLKREVSFPENFEDKFLQEFHRKQSASQVRSVSLVERIKRFFSTRTNIVWVYRISGAATVLAVSVIILTDVNPLSVIGTTASTSPGKSDYEPVRYDPTITNETAPQQNEQTDNNSKQ